MHVVIMMMAMMGIGLLLTCIFDFQNNFLVAEEAVLVTFRERKTLTVCMGKMMSYNVTNVLYMSWFNFILGLNFMSLCFGVW